MKSGAIAHAHMQRHILSVEVLHHGARRLLHELLRDAEASVTSLYSLSRTHIFIYIY